MPNYNINFKHKLGKMSFGKKPNALPNGDFEADSCAYHPVFMNLIYEVAMWYNEDNKIESVKTVMNFLHTKKKYDDLYRDDSEC
jgi:hypothetical protein